MNRKYEIWRRREGTVTCQVTDLDNQSREHDLTHVTYHSPDGFEFGYGGSGPADLAMSILADHFGEKPDRKQLYQGHCRCWHFHQDFKRHFVARSNGRTLMITSQQIEEWLALPEQVEREKEYVAQWEDADDLMDDDDISPADEEVNDRN